MKCHIVDYGTGNIQSVQNALSHLGHDVYRVSDSKLLLNCDCLIFPGQGAFGPAMKTLSNLGLSQLIKDYVQSKQPFIGICLGFQLLFDGSKEATESEGLSLFNGQFKQFSSATLSVPHMGWNRIHASTNNHLLSQFNDEQFYFVHSYYLPESNEPIQCTTNYGHPFVSGIANDTQLMTQFHPEKSGQVGLSLLETYFKSL